MGKPAATGIEMAVQVVTASLGALNAATTPAPFLGNFNIWVVGVALVGTVSVLVSYDGGTTFVPLLNSTGTQAITFTTGGKISITEYEPGVLYELQMTAYTSGSATVRISQGYAGGNSERLT